jgi:hypothetical protein
LRDVLLSFL